MDNCHKMKYLHHCLRNGVILTVCTDFNDAARKVSVGWSCWNPEDEKWIKKLGNAMAYSRLRENNVFFILSESEPVLSEYISLRALLMVFLNAGGTIRSTTRPYILYDVVDMLPKLAKRFNISSSILNISFFNKQ